MNGFSRIAVVIVLSGLWAGSALAQTEHFHPKGKPPSKHTLKVLKESSEDLPFSDTRDFEEKEKGFIAAPKSWTIQADAGNVAWDMERVKSLAAQIEDGTAKVSGDVTILSRLAQTLVDFNPRFEIMPGTAGPASADELNDYEVGLVEMRGE